MLSAKHEASQKGTIVSISAKIINAADSSCKSWDARHGLNESITKAIKSSQQIYKLAASLQLLKKLPSNQ